MIRGLLKLILVVVLLVAAAAFFFGYSWGDGKGIDIDRPVGTSGVVDEVDRSEARETGAEIGEAVADSANEAQRAAANGALTAKIKSKMALDDTVTAANIDVDTDGSVVTLSGRVASEAERQRAVTLARETDGVTSVNDRLTIR
jgi:hyperosmotically inducible protein